MEVESALVLHPKVAEAAVVGKPDELRGQAISAFVTLESGEPTIEELRQELAAKTGENVRIARFSRFEVGEVEFTGADPEAVEDAGE